MSSKFVTQEEHYSDVKFLIFFAGFIALIFSMFLYVIVTGNPQDKDVRKFIASQYNFSESECVERVWIACQSYEMCSSRTTCSKYCRTERKQVGEECEFRDILVNEVGLRCRESNCHIDKLSGLKVCESVCESWKDYKTEKVCTPKYENISTRCESGEDVRRARELIK